MNENLNICVGGRYRLQSKLGDGAFGVVYQAIDLENGEDVAIKLEHCSIESLLLEEELRSYEALSGCAGIPRVYRYDDQDDYSFLVFELLGPSLEDLFNFCGRKFSLKTVLMLADQLIHRLEKIHSKGIVHRDIKPDNFLMGLGKGGNTVYVIDFGIAREPCVPRPDLDSLKANLVGTALYASINGHLGSGTSRCDDLESLGYVFLDFIHGLPWQSLDDSREHANEQILEAKRSIRTEDLCAGLPTIFATYFRHIRAPKNNNKPNYSYLRKMFQAHFIRQGFTYDHVYDWTIRKYFTAKMPAPQ